MVRATEHFRSGILSGEYLPGQKLPTLVEAGEALGVHRLTVASAYRRLASEGLAVVKRSVGVFVAAPNAEAEVVLLAGAPEVPGSYVETHLAGLMAHYDHAGVRASARYISRKDDSPKRVLAELSGLIRERRLKGAWLISLPGHWVQAVCKLLREHGVPAIRFSARKSSAYSVHMDMPAGIRAAARHMEEWGCRRLLLATHSIDIHPENEEAFRATCEALKVEGDIFSMPTTDNTLIGEFMAHGEAMAGRLAAADAVPDGVLITDDFIGRGFMTRLFRSDPGLLDRLRICTFCRKGDAYPEMFGVAAAKLEADEMGIAEQAAAMMDRLIAGEEVAVPHLRLPLQLLPAKAPTGSEALCADGAGKTPGIRRV